MGLFNFFKRKNKTSGNGENKEQEKDALQQKPFAGDNSGLQITEKKKTEEKKTKKKLFAAKFKPKRISPVIIIILFVIFTLAFLYKIVIPKYMPEVSQQMPEIVDSIKTKGFGALSDIKEIIIKEKKTQGLITETEQTVEEAISVHAYRTAKVDFIDILPAMGTVKGDREVELRFGVSGVIDSINFYEGDLLKKGDIVATLEQKDALLKLEYAKSKLKTAEVARKSAEKKLEIHNNLFEQGIIIKAKLEEAEIELEAEKSKVISAQKEVEFSLAELDKTYLYSSTDGVMGTRDAETGEFVTSNVRVATIYDISYVLVEFGVIEKDVNKIALGQKATVSVDTYPGVDFTGHVDSIAPIIEGKSRTLTVRVRLKNDNPKGTLMPGMFARVWVNVYERKNTIKIPQECLKDLDNNGEYESVYVIDENNIAHARTIKIGYITSDFVEILDGLNEGEVIVSESMAELKDGGKVDIIETQEALF